MFPETAQRVKAAASLCSQSGFSETVMRWRVHRRPFSVSCCLTAKAPPVLKPRQRVEIPGLEVITFWDRMHFMPGLAKPVHPQWERDFKDPRYYRSPPAREMPLHKEKPCYVFNQRTSALEGVLQALWLTKTQLISGLPPQLLSLVENCKNQIPNQDERVKDAIKHARFWDTTQERPCKDKYSVTLLSNLLHLCATLQPSHPAIGQRMFAEQYSLGATWTRGEDLFQIRGRNGLLQTSIDPLPAIAGKEQVAETTDHILETFYPVSPSISLQKAHVYKEEVNCTGFRGDYPYPHAHTLFFSEGADPKFRLRKEQLRAKMLMFAFGNALARAHKLYGTEPQQTLDQPITVQAVGTNGRIFQFMVFQLNTTDLSRDHGIKNQVWLDADTELYEFAKVRPRIKKRMVQVPAGLAGYKPETFSKFLALYLHGAA